MRFLIAFVVIALPFLHADIGYDLTEGVVIEADGLSNHTDPSIYYMTMGEYAEPHLRVSLYYWWGDYEIHLDEIWYDDIEGNPYCGDSYCITGSTLHDIFNDRGFTFEFVKWIDETTFELQSNYGDGEVRFIVEYMGNGSLRVYKSEVYYRE